MLRPYSPARRAQPSPTRSRQLPGPDAWQADLLRDLGEQVRVRNLQGADITGNSDEVCEPGESGTPETWAVTAVPWRKEQPEAFAGLHARNVLVIFDEASAIADKIWETAEGAMTTPGAIWCVFGKSQALQFGLRCHRLTRMAAKRSILTLCIFILHPRRIKSLC